MGSTAALRGFRAQTPKPSTASAALAHPRDFLLGFAISVLSPEVCVNFLEAQSFLNKFCSKPRSPAQQLRLRLRDGLGFAVLLLSPGICEHFLEAET